MPMIIALLPSVTITFHQQHWLISGGVLSLLDNSSWISLQYSDFVNNQGKQHSGGVLYSSNASIMHL